jgi:hypothetical protein
MKSTMAYAAKRALFDELKVQSAHGMALDGVDVSYDYPPNPGRSIIYGGGVRFMHTDEAGEWNTVGSEVITIGVYVRVMKTDMTVREVEVELERIADTICEVFTDKPYIAGNMTWIGIAQGSGDYSRPPEGAEGVLSLQVMVGSVLV